MKKTIDEKIKIIKDLEEKDSPDTFKMFRKYSKRKKFDRLFDICIEGAIRRTIEEMLK